MKIFILLIAMSFLNASWAAEIASDCSAIDNSRGVIKKETQHSKTVVKSGKVSKK